jgi:MFS family permease
MDRVKLTMLSQSAIALQAVAIGGLIWAGSLDIATLLVLEVFSGIASSFAQPARQSLMPALVPRGDLPAAVACNSLCFNVARFIGPALAGPIIAIWGVVPAVLLNAAAYLFATATMPLLRPAPGERRGHAPGAGVLAEMVEGFRYAGRHPGIGPILLFAASASVLMRGVPEILPPFVERLFGQGPQGLALLTAAFGIGALISGLWVASRGRLAGATAIGIWGVGLQALFTIGFVATPWFPVAILCGALMGAAGSVHGISVQTLVQSAADQAMRGRVLSLWGMITRACPALGALVLGAAGEVFGLRLPVFVGMLLALLVFAWGLTRRRAMAAVLEVAPPVPKPGRD